MNTNPGANNADFDIYDQLRQEIRHLKSEVVSLSEQNVDLALQLGQVDELNLTVAEQKSMLKSLRQELQQREEELAQKRGSWQNVEERLKESEEQFAAAKAAETDLGGTARFVDQSIDVGAYEYAAPMRQIITAEFAARDSSC